jgi:mono/diheme cytochrome c family protein
MPFMATIAAQGQEVALTGNPWSDMNYGPYTTLTLEHFAADGEVEWQAGSDNIAYKGIAVRLDPGPGGVAKGHEWLMFETDTLNMVAGWTGDKFIDWRSIALDGAHEIHPAVVGNLVFTNPMAPGWARPTDGSFADARNQTPAGRRSGPLPADWADWKGLYVNGDQVVLSYSVGDTDILELPGAETQGDVRSITRSMTIAPRDNELILQVVHQPNTEPTLQTYSDFSGPNKQVALFAANEHKPKPRAASGGRGGIEFDGAKHLEVARTSALGLGENDLTLYARIETGENGPIMSIISKSEGWTDSAAALYINDGNLAFASGGKMIASNVEIDDERHYVVASMDTKAGKVTLYVDGKPAGEGMFSSLNGLSDPELRIGFAADNFSAAPKPFQGKMADVRVYSRAMGDEDLKRLSSRRGRRRGLDDEDQSIVGAWRSLEGSIAKDESDHNMTARVAGAKPLAAKSTAVAMVGGLEGCEWITTSAGDLRLRIPASSEPTTLKILYGETGSSSDMDAFAKAAAASSAPTDIAALTKGGPANWPMELTTQGELGDDPGAYKKDIITAPMDNPYRSWLRFGGIDFFEDDSKAALCTWQGDVWTVSGLGDSLQDLKWRRIAAGLFQPLGLKIVDDEIYVLGRDQITVLRDLNGDGETDFYENFNNDHQVTEHFHEFALDLQLGPDGNFYYNKSACHGRRGSVPQHGTTLRVLRDGSKTEHVNYGYRAPNGLAIGPNMEMLTSDNEGFWMPANRINWTVPGGFYGNMWAYHNGEVPTDQDQPLVWLPPAVDRSPGTFVWVPDDRWGPLEGKAITISYGMGHMFHLMYEEVDGAMQGGVFKFPLEFETGVCRAKFRGTDGQLYMAGLFGWSGNKTTPGAFYRVRYNGDTVVMPEELSIASDGLRLKFTAPLDQASATDPGNYGVKHWNYKWTEDYGSPQFKMDGSEGQDDLAIATVALSADRRTVFLQIPDIQPVMQMEIQFNLKDAEGADIQQTIYNTIHKKSEKSIFQLYGESAFSASAATVNPKEEPKARGLSQTISTLGSDGPDQVDTREARLLALHVSEGGSPSPFLDAEPFPFRSVWEGYIQVGLNQTYTLSTEGNGNVRLTVNGKEAFSGEADGLSNNVALKKGSNPIRAEFTSPETGDATFRLYWEAKAFPREPVPATAFARDAKDVPLDTGEQLRRGRTLLAENRCVTCHQPDQAKQWAMPELNKDAPVLTMAGAKFHEAWMADWILSPTATRENATMPISLTGTKEEQTEKASLIAAYLASLGNASTAPAPDASLSETGKAHFSTLGCIACHRVAGEDLFNETDTRISLAHIPAKWKPAALTAFLADPTHDYQWTAMPNFTLTEEESTSIAAYLLAQDAQPTASPATHSAANLTKGRNLLEAEGCLACHSVDDHQNRATIPSLAAIRKSNWKRGCLANTPDQRGNAPAFALTDDERKSLRTFATTDWKSLDRYSPVEFAARQIDALQCLACHARDGQEDLWTALDAAAPKVEEEFDPFAEESEELTIHLGRPILDWSGEKLRADWTHRLLAGTLTYKPRQHLVSRMPSFPAYAEGVAHGLAAEHGFSPEDEDSFIPENALIEMGQALTGPEEGFNCASCHAIGSQPALAGADTETINFANVPDRLRKSYFKRLMLDPLRSIPGSKMPQFATAEGVSTLTTLMDGDFTKQREAIWNFLLKAKSDQLAQAH